MDRIFKPLPSVVVKVPATDGLTSRLFPLRRTTGAVLEIAYLTSRSLSNPEFASVMSVL
jgi:hypothetical protein